MAKRKAARTTGRRKPTKRAKPGRSASSRVRRTSARPSRPKAASKRSRKTTKKTAGRARPAAARKSAGRKTAARKASARTSVARKSTTAARSAAARKTPSAARGAVTRKRPAAERSRAAGSAPARLASSRGKVPALNRERRIIRDDDIVPTPPSSLDLDRSASAARSGRRELSEKLHEHTETSPAITGGDIDADWQSAYSVGDEAPGGDNPTPDQDIVDDIGKALGVQYEDNEELKGEKKISDRDKKRWELDPASAEDYNEHDED
jgi:hypothetical protein